MSKFLFKILTSQLYCLCMQIWYYTENLLNQIHTKCLFEEKNMEIFSLTKPLPKHFYGTNALVLKTADILLRKINHSAYQIMNYVLVTNTSRDQLSNWDPEQLQLEWHSWKQTRTWTWSITTATAPATLRPGRRRRRKGEVIIHKIFYQR